MNTLRLRTRVLHPLNSLPVGLASVLGSWALLLACAPTVPKILNAVEIAEWTLPYGAELDVCRIEAKKLPREQRFDSYVKCEEEATKRTCARLGASARVHWDQCQEKLP